jgi:hypothetical protein
MGFSAGTLDLSVLGASDSAVASIDKTVKSLNSLSRAVNKINNSNFYSAGVHLEYIFSKIARATNSINSTNLNNLADAAKSLSGISKIGNLGKVDFEKVSEGFSKLSVSIEPFLEKVKGAETSLVALNGVLSKSSKTQITNALNGDGKSKDKSSLWSAIKWTTVLYTARRLGSVVANIVQKGSEYTETLNLWQVAMRNNLDMADEFVNKMNKAYGISSKTIMNAQATFKNMIGSLGQIDDATAYKLSEALVQMSADFSSLYNVQLESAFQKMQAMLAGQVRPIRSAGLDMTETTLYQYYQALGGTKSMRQLNRTEKQLLSILAVYKQMGSAGALGDMTKTLNQFANQSRMMTEYWSELKSWTGLILKDFLDQAEVLVYINAALITMTEVIKAIAKSKGLGEENFIDGMFETTEATNEEIDKLQGKLLEFDKFRSLDQSQDNALGIDEKLLEALTGYSSKIDEAQNNAQKLAELWLSFWLNDDKTLTENAQDFLGTLKELVTTLGVLLTLKAVDWTISFASSLLKVGEASSGLNSILLTGVIWAIIKAIEAFKEGDYVTGIIATTIGVVLVGALILYKLYQNKAQAATALLNVGIANQNSLMIIQGTNMANTALKIRSVATALTAMVAAYGVASGVINMFEGTGKKIASWAFIVVGAITAVTAAILAMNATISWGTALPVLLAGVGAAVAGVNALIPKPEMYATGASNIDSGTLFVAGEMGKTEAVYTGSNGKTNVANIQQMKAAYSQALNEWWAKAKYDVPSLEGVSDSGLYTIVDGEAKRRGKRFQNV